MKILIESWFSPGLKLRLPSTCARPWIASWDRWGNCQGTTSHHHHHHHHHHHRHHHHRHHHHHHHHHHRHHHRLFQHHQILKSRFGTQFVFHELWKTHQRSWAGSTSDKRFNPPSPSNSNDILSPHPHHLHPFSGKHCPKIVPTSARMSSWRSIWETGTPKYSDTKLVDTCSRDRDTKNIRKLFITAATAVQKRVKFCEFWSSIHWASSLKSEWKFPEL